MNGGLVVGSIVGGLGLYSALVARGWEPLFAIGLVAIAVVFVMYSFHRLSGGGRASK